MKIAAYAIAKNEEKHVARWYESVKDADYIFILDTGSTDNTVEIALSLGIEVQSHEFDPFRFDAARNLAISSLPEDIDICVVTDLDEVLTPGWREVLEELDPTINRVNIKAVVDFNPDGSDGLTFATGRVHGRHTHKFCYAIHEVLTPIASEIAIYTDKISVHHYPDNSKSRGQYLEMLKLAAEEKPNDERSQFYLAREYYFYGEYALAQHHFSRHLAISQWSPERAASRRYMAKMRPEEAEHHLYKAVAEDSTRRENWVDLADLYRIREDWTACRAACEMAFRIKTKPTDYFCEPEAWGWQIHDYMALACYHLGDHDEAWYHGAEALAINPEDERLQANLTWYRL